MSIELNGTRATIVSDDPLVIENPKTWSHFHSYGGWGKFFRGVREGKLWATRCTNPACREKRLFLPPRPDCVDCWHRTEWVEAPTRGRVHTFSIVRYPGELFRASGPCPPLIIAQRSTLFPR